MKNDDRVILQSRKQLRLLNCIIVRELTANRPDNSHPQCPHCGSTAASKRGFDDYAKQRYMCKGCHRSFTSSSAGELSSTKLPVNTWLAFAECQANHMTLQESASVCNVSLKTAWYMRKRLNATILDYSKRVKKSLQNLKVSG